MDETTGSQVPDIQGERQKFQADVAKANAADADRLGSLAAKHEVHTDANGVVLTGRDMAEAKAGQNGEDRRI